MNGKNLVRKLLSEDGNLDQSFLPALNGAEAGASMGEPVGTDGNPYDASMGEPTGDGTEDELKKSCDCGSGVPAVWVNDGYGIPLCLCCPNCREKKLACYRRNVLTHYDADEPIEPEE